MPATELANAGGKSARAPDFSLRPTPAGRPDEVNHPAHYTQGGVECIDALDAAVVNCPPDEAICVANVIKYVWRYTGKTPVQSLKKARWYLDRLIRKVESRYANGGARTGGLS